MHPYHPDWDSSTVNNAQREQLVQDAVTAAWNEAKRRWTIGTLPIVYRSASQNIWEPDPVSVASGASKFGELTMFLHRQTAPEVGWAAPGAPNAPEWLTNLHAHWPATSRSSESFYDFWNNVNEKCSLYLHAAARLASTAAQVAAAISDYQVNLLEAARAARTKIVRALELWRDFQDDDGSWPVGTETIDHGAFPGIMGGVSYATGVISLFPPAAPIAGPISVAAGTLSYIFAGGERTVYASGRFDRAREIHEGFMTDLGGLDANLRGALDAIRTQPPADTSTTGSQSFQSYAVDVVGNRVDWTPPTVVL
ncbi:hypothetical protein [Nocardioides sp. GXZ039]|uniref:hypothetical protein n=1 Tax=Nocardioides sp. GXZ039 TaxID=3136018 RepID=UPI0030F4A7F5